MKSAAVPNGTNEFHLTFWNLLVTGCTNSLTFNTCTLCPHCIYVFCIYLRENSDLCYLQHKLIGFYSRDEKCLQRGTDWVFKYSSLRFVFKGLMYFVCLCLSLFLKIEIQLNQYTEHKRHTYICFSLMMEAEPAFETFHVLIKNLMERG